MIITSCDTCGEEITNDQYILIRAELTRMLPPGVPNLQIDMQQPVEFHICQRCVDRCGKQHHPELDKVMYDTAVKKVFLTALRRLSKNTW